MTPVQIDLVWFRNAPEPDTQTVSQLDDSGEAVPFDLTGWTFRFQARVYPGAAGAPLIDLGMAAANAPGFNLTNAAAGVLTFTPPVRASLDAMPQPADITTGWAPFVYDVVATDPAGATHVFAYGRLTLLTGVTR